MNAATPKSKPAPTTGICTSDTHHIWVRGKNLVNDLIGETGFTEMMILHILKTKPTPLQVKLIDAVMVTIMEHGLTPTAIAARETFLGAPESLQGAVAAGILGVGSRFAGTSGDCAVLLDEIVATDPRDRAKTARAIAERFVAAKKPMAGFGHPVHRDGDPRVTKLVAVAKAAGAKGEYIEAMYTLSDALNAALGKKLVINASAAMGALMREAGVPSRAMRGFVLISRAAGIVGHLVEEMEQPAGDFIWHLVEDSVPYVGDKPT